LGPAAEEAAADMPLAEEEADTPLAEVAGADTPQVDAEGDEGLADLPPQ